MTHAHLTTATLATIPALVPHLLSSTSSSPTPHSSIQNANPITTARLRQALLAFLSPGGVIDRLGEGRDKARDAAREGLVVIGVAVHKYGGPSAGSFMSSLKGKEAPKSQETPLATFERFVRDLGLGSKVWRVREQVICGASIPHTLLSSTFQSHRPSLLLSKFEIGPRLFPFDRISLTSLTRSRMPMAASVTVLATLWYCSSLVLALQTPHVPI